MKFEYNKEKIVDLGLIVKHGNVQNIVMFWDENKNAVLYILEIYRIDWHYERNGFFEEVNILKQEIEIRVNGRKAKRVNKYLSKTGLVLAENKFASMNTWREDGYDRSEVALASLDKAKPVSTIVVERNKFYHSINDLPCGDYIVCLKVENRNGEVYAESAPYYFHINDAEETANKRTSAVVQATVGGW